MGKSGASPLYVVEVFKVPQTKELIMPDNVNRYYSQIMMGLCCLFAHNAICKITTSDTGNEKKTVSKCYCPLCVHLVGNHMTMNNHIYSCAASNTASTSKLKPKACGSMSKTNITCHKVTLPLERNRHPLLISIDSKLAHGIIS